MVKKNFWFITLCALLVISANVGLNVFLRIALFANAVVILIDVVERLRGLRNGSREKKD